MTKSLVEGEGFVNKSFAFYIQCIKFKETLYYESNIIVSMPL